MSVARACTSNCPNHATSKQQIPTGNLCNLCRLGSCSYFNSSGRWKMRTVVDVLHLSDWHSGHLCTSPKKIKLAGIAGVHRCLDETCWNRPLYDFHLAPSPWMFRNKCGSHVARGQHPCGAIRRKAVLVVPISILLCSLTIIIMTDNSDAN